MGNRTVRSRLSNRGALPGSGAVLIAQGERE